MTDHEFLLLGDALWLDFVNTARPALDALPDATAFQRWCRAVCVDPTAGPVSFTELRRFRERLTLLARALAEHRNPPPSAVEAINGRLAAVEGREHLVRIGGTWRIRFAPGRGPTALEAVAYSAAQSLAAPQVRIRVCANPSCGLFLQDDSPSQSRRWCSRSRCGQGTRVERRRRVRPTPLISEG